MVVEPLPSAEASFAPIAPRTAAAAARRTDPRHRHVDRHGEAGPGFARRQSKFGSQKIGGGALAEKRVAHAFDGTADGREVDGDLVREALAHPRWTSGV